jgi:hypothetical protein
MQTPATAVPRHSPRFAEIWTASLAPARLIAYQFVPRRQTAFASAWHPGTLPSRFVLTPGSPAAGRFPRGPAALSPSTQLIFVARLAAKAPCSEGAVPGRSQLSHGRSKSGVAHRASPIIYLDGSGHAGCKHDAARHLIDMHANRDALRETHPGKDGVDICDLLTRGLSVRDVGSRARCCRHDRAGSDCSPSA